MKLFDLIRPINYQKRLELESELEAEKRRLAQASGRAATRFRSSVLERRWFNEHPLETTFMILLGGYCAARWVDRQRKSRLTLRS